MENFAVDETRNILGTPVIIPPTNINDDDLTTLETIIEYWAEESTLPDTVTDLIL